MSVYYLIDILLLVLIGFLTYISYKKRLYVKILEYLKIFMLITLSASFAPNTGVFLQKNAILSGDTYSVLVLIGFGVNVGVLILLYLLLDNMDIILFCWLNSNVLLYRC